MENERRITFNHDDIEGIKGRMRELSDMNQELRLQIKEVENQRDTLKKHLDDALAKLFKSTIVRLEIDNNVHLKPITSDNAMTILFTDGFQQLAYIKDEILLYVNKENRRWAYDNAESFKWFIWKEKAEESIKQDELFEIPEERKSFKETYHEVRIQDLPAYLKIFRYEEKLKTSDIEVVSQTQWASYERGDVEPNIKTIKILEDFANFKLVDESGVKTIRIHDFGERLEKVANEKGFTLSEIGKKIGSARANIYNYKRVNHYPLANKGTMNEIAELLDESICYLLTGTREWE